MMRVMTWNLWWQFGPWRERAAAIAHVIREQAPDVLMLQEVWGENEHVVRARSSPSALGYHVAITDDTVGGARARPGSTTRSSAAGRCSTSSAIRCRGSTARPGIAVRSPRSSTHRRGRWPLVSTHLDHRFDDSAVRQVQAEALLRIVADLRGDPGRRAAGRSSAATSTRCRTPTRSGC